MSEEFIDDITHENKVLREALGRLLECAEAEPHARGSLDFYHAMGVYRESIRRQRIRDGGIQ